ncbi:MAG TPA: hypothetical protein PK490_13075 [Prosthecobacter sp.]|nr:hypothetical protein [Prosthecobacter sp.]HRK15220.1 hypothetical protein [Prosthecobacter sp.]
MRVLLKRLVIVAVLAVVIGVIAYQLLPPSEVGRIAVAQLAKADRFSFGGVGVAGSIPEREDWFFAILSSRHSARLFYDLFEQSTTTEARLYALAGLHLTDSASFRDCAARFAKEGSRVQTQGGCIASDCTAAEAVAAVERGDVERYLKLRRENVRTR